MSWSWCYCGLKPTFVKDCPTVPCTAAFLTRFHQSCFYRRPESWCWQKHGAEWWSSQRWIKCSWSWNRTRKFPGSCLKMTILPRLPQTDPPAMHPLLCLQTYLPMTHSLVHLQTCLLVTDHLLHLQKHPLVTTTLLHPQMHSTTLQPRIVTPSDVSPAADAPSATPAPAASLPMTLCPPSAAWDYVTCMLSMKLWNHEILCRSCSARVEELCSCRRTKIQSALHTK
jgi:hypothetical protein